jgi:hypothetical protein
MKPILSLLTALLLAPLAEVLSADTPAPKPNILWIVMDDVRVEMPCYGEKAIQRPNIDRLVHEGTTFTRAFLTSPVCSTARSAMITGMYQTTIGANNHVSGRGPRRIELPAGVCLGLPAWLPWLPASSGRCRPEYLLP